MNRRNFITTLAAMAAGATFDRERLLWVPGKKIYSIPPPRLRLRDLTDDNPYRRESERVIFRVDGSEYEYYATIFWILTRNNAEHHACQAPDATIFAS